MTRSSRLLALAALALAAAGTAAATASAASSACPTTNPPNELVLSSGNPQTAKVGEPFGSLQVAFANTNGCPVTGAAGTGVDWVVAPSGGAGATFASSGTTVAVTGANGAGVVTAPTPTANDVAGTYTVRAESDYGTVVFTLTNTTSGVVAAIAASGGAGQTATVDGRYAEPLTAHVTDAGGNTVQGASVTFVLAPNPYGAGASFLGGGVQATETTDSSGTATSPPVVANGTPGRFTATASTGGGLAAIATYGLDNHAATTTIAAAKAAGTAVVGGRYVRPLAARVLDPTGQPIEGIAVTFTIAPASSGAGASFLGGGATATVLADAEGLATSPPVVANRTAGAFTATASVTGGTDPAGFTLRNRAGRPYAIAAGAAASLSAPVRSRFPVRLAVTVTDADGNGVAGVLVAFAAPARGATGRFGSKHRRVVRARTDANGVAVAPPFRAGVAAGGYAVVARVHGVAHAAAFALVNEPRGGR